MPDPKFEARNYLRTPTDFGNPWVARPRWVLPAGGSVAFLWASVVQHAHACAVHAALAADRRFETLRHLCTARQLPYKRISEMLNGATVLRFEAVAGLTYHLGPTSLPAPADIDRILNQAAGDIGVKRPPHP